MLFNFWFSETWISTGSGQTRIYRETLSCKTEKEEEEEVKLKERETIIPFVSLEYWTADGSAITESISRDKGHIR